MLTPAWRPDENEAKVGILARHIIECPHQAGKILSRLSGPDGKEIAGGLLSQLLLDHTSSNFLRQRRQRRDARGHCADTVSGDSERIDHFAGHELGVGVHPRATTERQVNESPVVRREAVGQLGESNRGEIVDRHDRGSPEGRRNLGVCPMHDVDIADEQLKRWQRAPTPQCMQWPGRHGPLRERNARGQPLPHIGTPSPGDGEGRHPQFLLLAQRSQRAQAESTHAGRASEEGQRIHSHPEGPKTLSLIRQRGIPADGMARTQRERGCRGVTVETAKLFRTSLPTERGSSVDARLTQMTV